MLYSHTEQLVTHTQKDSKYQLICERGRKKQLGIILKNKTKLFPVNFYFKRICKNYFSIVLTDKIIESYIYF